MTAPKPAWENLSDDVREAWIQSIVHFYPEGTVTREDAIELARDEYTESESLMPEARGEELSLEEIQELRPAA